MFRLAGHLKKTVAEIEKMSAREFAEWLAYTRYFEAIPDSWRETGLLASAMLAPHCDRGKAPKADDFIPIEKPPQHQQQMLAQIKQLQQIFNG
jgi:hypothetical protein